MKLAIDPGHGFSNATSGQYDPGALGGGLQEADIVLAWALTGKFVLERAGLGVWLTRDSDTAPAPLMTRDERAVAAGCTHFLSLHCNAAASTASGTEAYYRNSAAEPFAALVLEAAVNTLKLPARGLNPDSASPPGRLAVLDFPGPATLLELGFITSATDRSALTARGSRLAFWERVVVALNA
jgi:N-acetylmuramoyl-L-alanine amidase